MIKLRSTFFCLSVSAYGETKVWFRHHQDEWEEVKVRWSASTSIRLHEIKKIPAPTFAHILDEYPILRRNDGYQLIKLDFNLLHRDRQDLLFNRFRNFRSKAKRVYETGTGDQAKPLLSLFQEQLSEGNLEPDPCLQDLSYSPLSA